MNWNIFFAVAIGLLTVTVAGLAGQLAAKEPWHKWVFWGGGFATLIFIGLQAASNERALARADKKQEELRLQIATLKDDIGAVQRKLNENPNASIGLTGFVPRNQAQEIDSEQPMEWNVAYGVIQNAAKAVRDYTIFQVEDSPPDGKNDRKVWAGFRRLAMQRMPTRGSDRLMGTTSWFTLPKNFTRDEALGIRRGTKTLYFLGHVEWNNPSGTDGHTDVCLWLQKPQTKVLTLTTAAWHNCTPP